MKYIVTYPLAAIVDQSADSSRLGQEVAISSDTVLKQVRSDAVYTFFKKYPETDAAIYRAAHEVFAACTKFTSGDDEVPAVSVAEQLSGLFDACAANDPEFEEEVPQASEGQAGLIIEPVGVEPHTLVDAIKKLHALNIAGKTDVYLLVYTDGSIAIHDGAEGDRPVSMLFAMTTNMTSGRQVISMARFSALWISSWMNASKNGSLALPVKVCAMSARCMALRCICWAN